MKQLAVLYGNSILDSRVGKGILKEAILASSGPYVDNEERQCIVSIVMTPIKGVGIDIIEIERFRSILKKRNDHFLKKTFSAAELKYCFSYADAAPHFAGTFAAKEAASKALGPEKFPVVSLEIRRNRGGKPEVWRHNKKIAVHLSISHTDSIAISIALR